jgi:RNA polymerase sigma-70 factor (ECF subfamily)
LYYYKDLKINEISSLIGLSPSGVKTRLLRAKKTLEKDLGGL